MGRKLKNQTAANIFIYSWDCSSFISNRFGVIFFFFFGIIKKEKIAVIYIVQFKIKNLEAQ